jgi:hypothetical protein
VPEDAGRRELRIGELSAATGVSARAIRQSQLAQLRELVGDRPRLCSLRYWKVQTRAKSGLRLTRPATTSLSPAA